jgi:hypothetical protein
MNIKDLLTTNAASFKAPPQFPAGNYTVVITSYDLLPFHWKKSGTNGLAYVPKIRPISCLEADDDSNPDLQAEQIAALEAYGDWTAREFQFAYTSKETQRRMASVSEINFPIIECDEAFEPVGILEKHAWRFYMRDANGNSRGFVAEVLGIDCPVETYDTTDDEGNVTTHTRGGKPLGEIFEDTIGKKFIATFGYEMNQNDPTRMPNLTITSVTAA